MAQSIHGDKATVAIGLQASGARTASGSVDIASRVGLRTGADLDRRLASQFAARISG